MELEATQSQAEDSHYNDSGMFGAWITCVIRVC